LIQYLQHQEIDKQRWDLCISQSLNSMLYGYSWYLDIVCPGWSALVVGDYEAVFPLPVKKKIYQYVFQPFFTQQLGLFYKHLPLAEQLDEVLSAIPHKYRYIDVQLNEALVQQNISKGKIIKRKNYVLPLNKPYEKLVKKYSEHTRRNLKKATRHPQQVVACDTSVIIDQYRTHKGAETKGLDSSHYVVLQQLFDTLFANHLVKPLAVSDDKGDILSSAAFAICNTRIYYLMGSSSKQGKEERSIYLLFDHMIRHYSGHPFELDFEGSEIPGVARLFKGFGAEKRDYVHLRINRLPWLIRWMKG
jgi:hypothetical protein